MKLLTTEEFIKKAKQIHGNKYNYKFVCYNGNRKKIKIICPEHGIFEQNAGSHLNGTGCPACKKVKKLTIEEFIEKAKQVHGDKYDYSLVNYININTKVQIICSKHGVFEQTPNNHLSGQSCPKCVGSCKYTTEKFIEKAKQVHSDKYDYSLVNYININTKVQIICSEHGIFEQTPNGHLQGQNCAKCSEKYSYTTNEFIERVKEVHGDKYDYSLVEYKNSYTKIKIICPEHGIFEQTPNNHLSNHGCPICKESKGEKLITQYLIKNDIMYIKQHKFNNCKNKQSLPFDFYIVKHNICIEYDGEQHFILKKHWGGINSLKYIQQNDNIKTKYCKYNNIQLIRIKYNENIEEKLNNLLF